MGSHFIFRMLAATAVLFLCSAAVASEHPMDCVEELAMPYIKATQGYIFPGAVEVHILVGKHGHADKIEYDYNGKRFPAQNLSMYFWYGTRYLDVCEGKTISFTVRFVLEGEPTDRPEATSEVQFTAPKEFIVKSHPVKPPSSREGGGPFLEPMPGQRVHSPDAKFCDYMLYFVDSEREPVKHLSTKFQPSDRFPPVPDEYSRVFAIGWSDESVLVTGTAPHYKPVQVNLPCPKEADYEQFVVMTKK